jgi:hypothetical protein
MPTILTNRVNRKGEGKPRFMRFRITWPEDATLQDDSEKGRLSKLFVLEIRDDQGETNPWQRLGSYADKGLAQKAAGAEAGHPLKDSDWHTAEEERAKQEAELQALKDNLAQKEIQVLDYRNAHLKTTLNRAIRDLKLEITRKTDEIYGPD